MKFWEAMKALEEGKKVRRKYWGTGAYTDNNDEQTYVFKGSESNIDEWEIYEEPKRTFSFMEIVPLLKEGRNFRRKIWCQNEFIFQNLFEGLNKVSVIGYERWYFLLEDLEARDWIEVKK